MIELQTPAYRKAAFALSFGSFLVFCNLYLFQPMLPVFADAFVVTATKANWLLASSTLGLSLSLLPWAMLSEKIGRRPVILVSLVLMPLVGFLSFFASGFILGACGCARLNGHLTCWLCCSCGCLYG